MSITEIHDETGDYWFVDGTPGRADDKFTWVLTEDRQYWFVDGTPGRIILNIPANEDIREHAGIMSSKRSKSHSKSHKRNKRFMEPTMSRDYLAKLKAIEARTMYAPAPVFTPAAAPAPVCVPAPAPAPAPAPQ